MVSNRCNVSVNVVTFLLVSRRLGHSDLREGVEGRVNMARSEVPVNMLVTLLIPFTLTTGTFAQGSLLYATNGTHILLENTAGTFNPLKISVNLGRVVGLAVDVEANLLFWSDIRYGFRGIYRSGLDGSNAKQIIKDVIEVNSLTVDWSAKNLYWTDAKRRMIGVSDYEGKHVRVLISGEMKQPRGIVADPVNSYLFWNDQGEHVIARSRLDGSERRVLLNTQVYWPNQMIMDWDKNKLMWVDAANGTLMSCDLNGQNVKQVANMNSQAGENPVFGLAMKSDKFYVSVWNKCVILEVSGTGAVKNYSSELGNTIFSMAIKSSSNPKSVKHQCGQNKGSCSHLCLPTSLTTKRCSCPSFGGKSLNAAGTTCQDPQKVVIFALGDLGQVCFIDLESPKPYERHMITWALRPVAVGYNPTDQYVYYSDVFEKRILKMKLDGSGKPEVFLDRGFGIGVVDGLLVDWKNKRLFYSNMGFQSVNGYSFTWHKIDMVSLENPTNRRTIVSNTEKPRALAVDESHLYWTDWGEDPKLMRVNLDGTNVVTIRRGLDNPNGIALTSGEIFMLDSHYRKQNGGDKKDGSLYIVSKKDGSIKEIKNTKLKVPFGLTVTDDNKVFVSDWSEKAIVEITSSQWSAGKASSSQQIASQIGQPMGLLYTKRVESSPVVATCTCSSNVCLGSDQKTCSCSSYAGKILQPDSSTCKGPANFLAFTDMNSVKIKSLDGSQSDRSLHIIKQGDSYRDNYVSMAYDSTKKNLYYADVNRKRIFRSKVDGSEKEVFYNASQLIDGMHIDPTNRKLYWTASNDGYIVRLSLDSPTDSYEIFQKGLDKPRAIQIFNGYVYWTEWGKKPRIARRSLTGNIVQNVTSVDGLKYLNALLVTSNEIIFGDGYLKKIYRCKADGTSCKELRYITGIPKHIFSIAKIGDFLYFSDWYARRLMMVNMVTGTVTPVVENLMRPAQFIIHYNKLLACPAKHGCSDRCFPYAGGYQCGCPAGKRLSSDQKTCVTGAWQTTFASLCNDTCSVMNSVCSRRDSSTGIECQCAPGYHGDASTSCTACGRDTYKANAGRGTCLPCPTGSSTRGHFAQTSCHCQNNLMWQDGKCAASSDGKCPMVPLSVECSASPECRDQDDCSLGKKCCAFGACGNRCQNPKYASQCVLNGRRYDVGVTFIPDICHVCTCHQEVWLSGKTAVTRCIQMCNTTETMFGEKPVFENCPDNLVELNVPEDSNMAQNIRLNAFDYTGSPLKVNYKPSLSYLKWKGLGSSGKYQLTATVMDDRRQQSTCRYEVLIKDTVSPSVTCPEDLVFYTSGFGALVFWPTIVATDNVAESPVITTSHEPGRYRIGSQNVLVTAKDDAGNEANCDFTINVIYREAASCRLFDVPHGSLGVISGADYAITCRSPYILNRSVRPKYTCKNGMFDPSLGQEVLRNACLKENNVQVKKNFNMKFPGCTDDSSYFNQVTESVSDALLQGFKTDNVQVNRKDMSVTCENQSKKRSELYTVVTVEAKVPVRASNEEALSTINNFIQKVRSAASNGSLSLEINRRIVIPTVWEAGTHTIGCNKGEILSSAKCYVCNIGTREVNNEICEVCPVGTYQPLPGQQTCMNCPAEMKTMESGAYSSYQCQSADKAEPPNKEDSSVVPVVVGVIVAVLVIVVIIIVVVVLLRRRRSIQCKASGEPNTYSNPMFTDDASATPIYAEMTDQPAENPYFEIKGHEAKGEGGYENLAREKPVDSHLYSELGVKMK